MGGINENGLPNDVVCECCSPRRLTFTATTPHKWTLAEVKDHIYYHAQQVIEARWYNRGERTRRLQHWLEKLQRFEQVFDEIELQKNTLATELRKI